MSIHYKENVLINEEDLKNLYEDVKWTAYTKDMTKLTKAINNSLNVISVWDKSRLIGLIRVIGDGQTIIYIQDILVLEDFQGQGIGSVLMKKILEKYKNVRQKVLLTEDAPNIRGFYEKFGFISCDKGDLVAFSLLNNS